MRLSLDKNDPAYSPERLSQALDCKIFLGGIEQKLCVTADEEMGLIVRYVTDNNGQVLLDDKRERGRTETVTGKVKIVLGTK